MNIESKLLADIVPYAKNAKKHDNRQINNTDKYIHMTLNIPLWNVERGRSYTLSNFSSDLKKFLKTPRNVNRDLINWTSSLSENDNQYSVALYFASSDLNMLGWSRAYGSSVRAVLQE